MMEFLLYLTPIGFDIIQNIANAKYKISENVEFCKNPNLFGYADFNRKLVICTENIKRSNYDVETYVNKTVYHEAVHVAQLCNGYKSLGIPMSQMVLSSNKLQGVQNSVKASTASAKMEHEAYWMEDMPYEANQVVKKYCL